MLISSLFNLLPAFEIRAGKFSYLGQAQEQEATVNIEIIFASKLRFKHPSSYLILMQIKKN